MKSAPQTYTMPSVLQEEEDNPDESEKAHEEWIQQCVDKYRSSQSKKIKTSTPLSKTAKAQWMELDIALNHASEYYRLKQKKTRLFNSPLKN